MALTEILASTIPIELSFDSEVSWKTLVCLENYTHQSEGDISESETWCGKVIGMSEPSVSLDFSAVCNSTPDGGTEASYADLQTVHYARTKIFYRIMAGTTGRVFYHKGEGYITSLSLDASSASDTIKFSGTLTTTGTIDVTP